MAVSRVKRIQILGHKSAKDDVLASLRQQGVLHITEPSFGLTSESEAGAQKEHERDLEASLAKLEYMRNLLKAYAPKAKSLEKILNPKLLVREGEVEEILRDFDWNDWYVRCIDLEGRMRSAEAGIGRKEALAAELERWSGLGLAVEELVDTTRVGLTLLTVEGTDLDGLAEELAEAAPESDLIEAGRFGSSINVAALYFKENESSVIPLLKRHNARRVDLSGGTGTPDKAAARLRDEAEELRQKREAMRGEATALALEHNKILIVLDEASEELAKRRAERSFATTKDTFTLEGWIRGREEASTRENVEAVSKEIHIATRDPEPGEEVPIDLENRALIKPFEFVTTLYGRPVYREFDPTPLLAPFFILFFGLCVSDAGYGLTVAILAFFLMKKMQAGEGTRRLLQLMVLGGISTAVVGALTGGWFGIDPVTLPQGLRSIVLINPLAEPMKMLNVAFAVGILHIFFGLGIRMAADFKEGRWVDGILDQLVWIVFLAFLVPLGYSFILGADVPEAIMQLSQKGSMAAGLIVVATGARKNPNPIMKVLGGVLKLYDIVGYFGDVLSYARLLALGLATGAIAMAINGVAEMAAGIPLAGPVAAIFVIVLGHLFNLAVNCLGGFVHSGRLQYLEFFSKFFQGGGTPFIPFRVEKKYSMVKR